MGILFISITVGIVILAIIIIINSRKNKTIDKAGGPGAHSVLEKETGKDKGVYD